MSFLNSFRNNLIKTAEPKNKCKVCGWAFFEKPLLHFKNMPAKAQHLPEQKTLNDDKGIDLVIYQCSGCGLVQLNCQPVAYYKEVIRAVDVSDEMKEFRIKQFNEFVKEYSLQNKKIIEIGCGKGEYLSIISQTGTKAYGLEFSDGLVKQCQNKGLKVTKGFVEDEYYEISDGPFDVFYLLSYLEHLPNPNQVLKGIRNNLTDEAVGLIEVPNFDMILKKKLFSEFMLDHLFYFSRQTLTTTLELNGFEVIAIKEIWHDYIISAIVKKRSKYNLSSFNKNQEKLKQDVDAFISEFRHNKVAIWGAGHQALSIISLFNLAGQIKYVVDSAEFKQGKFTPASHLPIVSPDSLKADPVEAVMVIAGSYSDEVVRIIKENNKDIRVSVLRDFGLEKIN